MTIEQEAKSAANLAISIPGQMRRTELQFLYKLARQKGPIVEIGCLHGLSTAVLVQAAMQFSAKVTSIDPFLPTPNTLMPSKGYWRQNLIEAGLTPPEQIEMMSHDAASLYDDEIGLLFIDGSHNYHDVQQDIADWAPKVKKNGIIAFHDMWQYAIPGVARAVMEWWTDEFSPSEFGSHGLADWRFEGQVDFLIAFRRVA